MGERGREGVKVDYALRIKTDQATPGYTLFAPLNSDTTFLIDNDGQVVRTWRSELAPGASVYMLNNGHLMRTGSEPQTAGFSGGGQGGRFQEFTFEGELVWDFSLNDATRLPHHDMAMLPNGNVLAVVWELKGADEAREAGRRQGFIPERGLWPDMLIELAPERPKGAKVVWEWHMWDHLVQNVDAALPQYGNPSERPERIDLNGDLIGTASPPANPPSDFFHTNAVAYNPSLDQILMSVPRFNEMWEIDHSTTTAQARGSSGGRSGKGGDLLYRWGDPQRYGRGVAADQRLGFQHDTRWIPDGFPGAGHMLAFSNRTPGPNGEFSRVYEIAPPVGAGGRYTLPGTGPFGPSEPVWTYSAPDFQATFISGATRLANGNTLITSGPQGRFFEVTPAGQVAWEYWSRYTGAKGGPQGAANPYAVFRATRIPTSHPAVAGRTLRPLDPQPPERSPAQ